MKVPAGYAVLDCGAAKSLCVSETCRSDVHRHVHERVNELETSATLRQSMRVIHFRGIGNQIVSSFKKLRVPGSTVGKEVSFAPSVTPGDIPPLVGNDNLIPWGCSICIQMSVVSKSHLVELMQSCL